MNDTSHSSPDLRVAARQTMLANGFEPDFPPQVAQQLAQLQTQAPPTGKYDTIRDLRGLLWSSIDNDTSRDLDQVEVAQRMPNGEIQVMVGVADVDAFVPKGSPIDLHAAKETTTVYAGVQNFSMLPDQLSTGTTSLLEEAGKLSIIVEFTVSKDGSVKSNDVYRAWLQNKAQLTYNAVGAWLENTGPAPAKVAASSELQSQLKLQSEASQALKAQRFAHGALNIDTIETQPVLVQGQVSDIVEQRRNLATELIENFMIAANGVVARSFELQKRSSIRRVVQVPKRWDRIVEIASQQGGNLPPAPDSKALNDFLVARKAADPDHFADLSLAVVKLLGPGEYVLVKAGAPEPGHFALAVQDYTHATAPNRRFADLITQRLLKAMLAGQPAPYSDDELAAIARDCTLKEDAARKVEREMAKRMAAVAMAHRIGESFDAIVTGVSPKGTFVRVLNPRVEGMLTQGQQGMDVGERIRVKLIRTDPQRGFIDFARIQ